MNGTESRAKLRERIERQEAEIERLRAISPPEPTEGLRAALQKIADLVDSEADEPLDDAIAIANAALAARNAWSPEATA